MPHPSAIQHGSRERSPRPSVRTPVPDLDGLGGGRRRLPRRLRRATALLVPPG